VAVDASVTQEDEIPTLKINNPFNTTSGGITQLLLKSGQSYSHQARFVYKALSSGTGDLYIIVGTTVVATFSRTGSVSFASTPIGLVGLNTNNIYTKRQFISAGSNLALDLTQDHQDTQEPTFKVGNSASTGWAQIIIDPSVSYRNGLRIICVASNSSDRDAHFVLGGLNLMSFQKKGFGGEDKIDFNGHKVKGIGSLDLSGLGSYADDAAASTGGVAIGYAYINSATGAMHRRLT